MTTIAKANKEKEIELCFHFFRKMWKELFSIDFDKNINERLQSFKKSDVNFIEEN